MAALFTGRKPEENLAAFTPFGNVTVVDMSDHPVELVGRHAERLWIEQRIVVRHPDLWFDGRWVEDGYL